MRESLLSAVYEESEEDVIALQKRMMRTSSLIKDVRRRNIINAVVAWFIVVGVFSGASYALSATHAAGVKRVIFWVVLYILIAPFFFWRHLSPRASFKKLDEFVERGVRTGKIAVSRGTTEVSLDNDDLVVSEVVIRPLSAVVEVAEAEDGLYITFSDGVLLRVPARAFTSPVHRQAFMDAVKRYVGRRP